MFRFIGMIIGLIGGGFFGAVLGFFLGSLADRALLRNRAYRNQHRYSQKEFVEIILVLTAAVMKADGSVRVSELDYVKNYLRQKFAPETAQRLLLQLRDILEQEHDVESVCEELRQNAANAEKFYILQFLFGLAAADGKFSPQELLMIEKISDLSGLSRMDYESVKAMYIYFNQGGYAQSSYGGGSFGGYSNGSFGSARADNLENDYKILEINPSATDEEVKRSYRAMAKKYHPDKMNHLGEEIRRDAEEKFSKMNQAYERIKKSRGMN